MAMVTFRRIFKWSLILFSILILNGVFDIFNTAHSATGDALMDITWVLFLVLLPQALIFMFTRTF